MENRQKTKFFRFRYQKFPAGIRIRIPAGEDVRAPKSGRPEAQAGRVQLQRTDPVSGNGNAKTAGNTMQAVDAILVCQR